MSSPIVYFEIAGPDGERLRYRYSYRGLAPHQFMPMPGIHKGMQLTALRATADAGRFVFLRAAASLNVGMFNE